VSNRDTRFRLDIWQKLHEAFGTLLRFSTTFHPITDRQMERTIQTLEDMPRACALDFKKAWDEQLALIEFSYNNYHASIGMAPYETLYVRRWRTPLCCQEIDGAQTIGPELIQATTDKIWVIQERMRAAQSHQKSYPTENIDPLNSKWEIMCFSKYPQPTRRVTPTEDIEPYNSKWEIMCFSKYRQPRESQDSAWQVSLAHGTSGRTQLHKELGR